MPDNSTHGKRKGPHPAPRTVIWAVAATSGTYSLPVELSDENTASATMTLK